MTDFLIIFFKKLVYININLLFATVFALLIIKGGRIKNSRIRYIIWAIVLLRFIYDMIFNNPSGMIFTQFPEHGTLTVGFGMGLTIKSLCASLWDNYGNEFTSGTIISSLLGLKATVYISFFVFFSGLYLFFRNIINYFLFKRRVSETLRLEKYVDNIKIYTSDYIESPFVFGMIKPAIVLPLSIDFHCTDNELGAIIDHEYNHIKRKSHIIFPVLYFLKSLFFCVLPLRIVLGKLEEAEEQICDKMVVEKNREKKSVADALLKIAGFQLQVENLKKRSLDFVPAPGFVKDKKVIEKRLKNIYTEDKKGGSLKYRLLQIPVYIISWFFILGCKIF